MAIRWQFLTEDERRKLEDYDLKVSGLIGKQGKGEVEKIKQLHQSMDCFIIELQEKYCPATCTCRKR